MTAPPYQKFFWGSYHKHTAHLRDARDHGAYLLLIGALWNNGGRLPADDDTLSSYAKLTLKEWALVKPKLMPLFTVSRGKLTQDRVTEDLAKYADTSGKRKQAGKSGGNASAGKRKGNRTAIATDLPTQSEPESEPKKDIARDGFERWWECYPRKTAKGSARKAYAAALKKTSAENLLAAVVAYPWPIEIRFIPHPATWLNGERWDDDAAPVQAAPDEDIDPWERRLLRWQMAAYWNSEWGPKPGKPGYLGPPISQAEAA